MTPLRFIRFAAVSALVAGLSCAGGAPLAAAPKSPHPIEPHRPHDIGLTRYQAQPAPDLTVRIKSVSCFQGNVAVKLRLQDLEGGIPIVAPFVTEVTVGNHTAVIASGASPQNPWYNGQEKGVTIPTGPGSFAVSARIDATSLVHETDESDNVAPSPANGFDSNPSPLIVTCDDGDSANAQSDRAARRALRRR